MVDYYVKLLSRSFTEPYALSTGTSGLTDERNAGFTYSFGGSSVADTRWDASHPVGAAFDTLRGVATMTSGLGNASYTSAIASRAGLYSGPISQYIAAKDMHHIQVRGGGFAWFRLLGEESIEALIDSDTTTLFRDLNADGDFNDPDEAIAAGGNGRFNGRMTADLVIAFASSTWSYRDFGYERRDGQAAAISRVERLTPIWATSSHDPTSEAHHGVDSRRYILSALANANVYARSLF